ncbi:MAG: glycosyltransferase [Betaproteobacteria bacterium]|nr:MAG: glycosyltransferase [Betaproteobacteria bacterium]
MVAPQLSLVVPVYNVAPFLPRCLQSLATEPVGTTEVILVDDGSTDACPETLAAWAEARPHARIIRQPNAGLSAARNTGLDQARGRYLAFVDSDDYYDAGYYGRLAALCEAQDLELAIGNASYHFEDGRAGHAIYADAPPAGVMRGADFLRHRLRNRTLLHMVWMHLYRRDWLERHRLRFVPGLIHEDVPWTTRVLLLAQRVAYDPTPGYHYRQRVRRFGTADNDRRLQAIIDSAAHNARALDALANGVRGDAELQHLLRWQLVDGGLSIFHKLRQLSAAPARRERLRHLRRDGIMALLWRNATEFAQRRRIARNYLKSLLGAA